MNMTAALSYMKIKKNMKHEKKPPPHTLNSAAHDRKSNTVQVERDYGSYNMI